MMQAKNRKYGGRNTAGPATPKIMAPHMKRESAGGGESVSIPACAVMLFDQEHAAATGCQVSGAHKASHAGPNNDHIPGTVVMVVHANAHNASPHLDFRWQCRRGSLPHFQ